MREIRTASGEGVGCIVDGGHPDLGRDLDACRRVANETDVHVVVSGGYYTEAFYPPDLAEKSDDEIADGLVAEAIRDRLGAFGEIGQTSNVAEMTPLERKVFQAIGKAHVQSGIPIFTHNAYGTGENVTPDQGLEQLDVLESVGVDPRTVAIGHACCLDDPSAAVLMRIAARGAYVGFDRVTGGRVDDPQKVATILAFLEGGYADRLLISSDYIGRRSPERPGYGNASPCSRRSCGRPVSTNRRSPLRSTTTHAASCLTSRRCDAAVVADWGKEKRMRLTLALSIIALLAVTIHAQSRSTNPVASIKQLQEAMISPSSDTIFNVGRAAPASDEEWLVVRNAAVILAEAGNLLMLEG